MANKFSPGGCCCGSKCWLFGIGMKEGHEQYTTGTELEDQIAAYSVDPNAIVVVSGLPAIAAGATWAAKSTADTKGFLLTLKLYSFDDGTDYSIIAAPAGTPLADIEGSDSIILRQTKSPPAAGTWTVTLKTGFEQVGYGIGSGPQTISFSDFWQWHPGWLAWLEDSVETGRFSNDNVTTLEGLDLYNLSRSLSLNVKRDIYVRNHNATDPVKIAFMGENITDYRPGASNPNPTAGKCRSYTPSSSGTRFNEPFAIKASITGGNAAAPLSYSPASSSEGSILSASARTPFSTLTPASSTDVTAALDNGETVEAFVNYTRGLRCYFGNPEAWEATGSMHPLTLVSSTSNIYAYVAHWLSVPFVSGPEWQRELMWSTGNLFEDHLGSEANRLIVGVKFPPWDRGAMPAISLSDAVQVADQIGDYEVLSVSKPAQFIYPISRKFWLAQDEFGATYVASQWVTGAFSPSIQITQQLDAIT